MNKAISKEALVEILNAALKDVTEKTAGVRLHEDDGLLGSDVCTVNIKFEDGYDSALTLCADKSMLTQMAKNTFRDENVSLQDVEDFSKEYFNVLCGKVVQAVFKASGIPSRFGTPEFYSGRFEPDRRNIQFVLTFADDQNGHAQLIHHIPDENETLTETNEGGNNMKKRIMVVDDSRLVRVQMEDVLDGTDYEIVAYCNNGEDAVAQYEEVNPDLVTMDIIMPRMDGFEAAEAILKQFPDARIVMVSSLAYDDSFKKAEEIGTKGFVDKPFHRDQLVGVFEKALK